MEGVEAEGRTVNEATDKALTELGLRRDQVTVEVLSEGRPRLLGFLGEPARVLVTPFAPPAPVPVAPSDAALEDAEEYEDDDEDEDYDEDEDEDEGEHEEGAENGREQLPPELLRIPVDLDNPDVVTAVGVLEDLLRLSGVEASVTARAPETAGDGVGLIEAVLDVEGEDLGILIGRRGSTLASLQYILNLIVSRKTQRRVAFGVDVDGYRRRREEALVTLAKRTASRVRGTGRSITLEPMPPNERRIVHLALANDPAVMTVSIGEGEERKVAITPTR